ncbi:hypothetical protein H0A36_02700 [Endozoicomonas sp. SM1973]|uniref:Uncharacterized protein n=2 Tax=Spartinivicinus marinus TaxID=2994442 RepID=A0A853HSZ3_9GAMM|nr:hypothetical protein [Spartinivicinus marinus]MCX4029857.1 hypothetical protein [Spartinivicinus marinus]NYZ64900.1 hypothetical protein [Spartinivicinus marinus]
MKKLQDNDVKAVLDFLDSYFVTQIEEKRVGTLNSAESMACASILLDMSMYLLEVSEDTKNNHALYWLNRKLLAEISEHIQYQDHYPNRLLINNIKSLQMGIDGSK